MLKNLKKKLCIAILHLSIFILISCGKNENLIVVPKKIEPLETIYKKAFNFYEIGDWNNSIDLFKKVESNYSFSDWAPKATLFILYMYYEANESYKALEYVKKFKTLYPRSEHISYVYYIEASIFYEQINVVSKDQTYSEEALKKFNYILKNYPNSIYAEDSVLKIDLINEQLAGKEMYLARYYMNKSKWIAAIKRLNIILEKYDTTIYIKEALHRLVEIYYKLGNIKEAQKYAAILGYNFNDSDWYKKTYTIVRDKDYVSLNKKSKKKLRDKIQNIFKFSK